MALCLYSLPDCDIYLITKKIRCNALSLSNTARANLLINNVNNKHSNMINEDNRTISRISINVESSVTPRTSLYFKGIRSTYRRYPCTHYTYLEYTLPVYFTLELTVFHLRVNSAESVPRYWRVSYPITPLYLSRLHQLALPICLLFFFSSFCLSLSLYIYMPS